MSTDDTGRLWPSEESVCRAAHPENGYGCELRAGHAGPHWTVVEYQLEWEGTPPQEEAEGRTASGLVCSCGHANARHGLGCRECGCMSALGRWLPEREPDEEALSLFEQESHIPGTWAHALVTGGEVTIRRRRVPRAEP